jgi:hypothetical protein
MAPQGRSGHYRAARRLYPANEGDQLTDPHLPPDPPGRMITLKEALNSLSEQEMRAVLAILASWNGKLVAQAIRQAAAGPTIRGELG